MFHLTSSPPPLMVSIEATRTRTRTRLSRQDRFVHGRVQSRKSKNTKVSMSKFFFFFFSHSTRMFKSSLLNSTPEWQQSRFRRCLKVKNAYKETMSRNMTRGNEKYKNCIFLVKVKPPLCCCCCCCLDNAAHVNENTKAASSCTALFIHFFFPGIR